jgi:hypothetical protein
MDLHLFFNGLSIPKQISQLFEGRNSPFEQLISMLAILWTNTHIHMSIQNDSKQILREIAVPPDRTRTEYHFWRLFLDRSCNIKWQDETISRIFENGSKYYIDGDDTIDAAMLFGAFLEKLILVSFNAHGCFGGHEISLVREREGKQIKQKIENMCSIDTAKLVIREYVKEVSSDYEIRLFPITYPKLKFCDTAKKDYSNRKGDETFRKQTRYILEALNRCPEETTTGQFDVRHFWSNVTPDTPNKLKSDRGERAVKCPDGEIFTFSYHAKSSNTRVYFDTRYDPDRHILIGRILPVSSHPS